MHSNYTVLTCDARIILMAFPRSFFFQIKLFFFLRRPGFCSGEVIHDRCLLFLETQSKIFWANCILGIKMWALLKIVWLKLWLKAPFYYILFILFILFENTLLLRQIDRYENGDPINHGYWFTCVLALLIFVPPVSQSVILIASPGLRLGQRLKGVVFPSIRICLWKRRASKQTRAPLAFYDIISVCLPRSL